MEVLNNEILIKICKTCTESKEIKLFRTHSKMCKMCYNRKNKERKQLIYYRKKYNNESLTIAEINFLMVMTG